MRGSDHIFKKMAKPMPLAISLILIAFTADQTASGYTNDSNQEQYLDFQSYTGNRLNVFNDTQIDYCVTNNNENASFNHIAANAIQIWHDKIVAVTNNPFVWNMTTYIQPEDESVCDGYLNYVDTPNPTPTGIFPLVNAGASPRSRRNAEPSNHFVCS